MGKNKKRNIARRFSGLLPAAFRRRAKPAELKPYE